MPKPLRPVPLGNALLDSLPRGAREVVVKACGPARLAAADILCKPSDRIQRVYFPTTACISLIAPSNGTETLEVGMVGNEGMFGITVLLEVKTSPLTGLVQGEGHALQMGANRFARLANDVAPFRKIVHRYLFVLTAQIAQTATCNRFHSLDSRLARWLLMTRDRAHSNAFHITHEFLAYMLGVRRAGVTRAATSLQSQKLIRYSRGSIVILDGRGLEAASCSCYAHAKQAYDSVIN